MKKITRFAVAAALALTMMLTIVACTETEAVGTKTGTAYGIVHKSYVGFITVKTDKSDKVTSVAIDEAFLLASYAQAETGEDFGTDVVTYTKPAVPPTDTKPEGVPEITTKWAKYMSIDGKLFTADAITGTATSPTYKSGTDESVAYITANTKAYVTAVQAGKVFVAKADGTKLATANSYGGATKATGTYWAAGGVGMGWKANMAKLSAYFVANGFNFTDADIKNPTGSGTAKVPGMIGDVTTGATLSDFADYVKLAKKAFDARA